MSKRSLAIAAAGVGGSTDPNFKNVALLLQGDVSNPDLTYNAFSDASSNNFPITPNGDAYGSSFSPYNTSWSNYFDGTGDDLRADSNAAFAMGTGDFTFECWLNPANWTANYAPVFVVAGTGGLLIAKNGSNFVIRAYGVADQLTYSTMPTIGAWTHVVAVRSGTTLSLYYNGNRVATATNSYNFAQAAIAVGSDREPSTPSYYTGYISNLRLVKGTAIYDPTQSTITVPTSPLTAVSGTSLLTCQSNRFIDNSSNNFAITRNGDVAIKSFSPFTDTDTTTGSGYFDGNGDYLDTTGTSVYTFGTGDFTVEFWLNLSAIPTYTDILGTANNTAYLGASKSGFVVYYLSTGKVCIAYQSNNAWVFALEFTNTLTTSSWNHIAFSRASGSMRCFVNGSQVGSTTSNTTNIISTENILRIGGGYGSVTGLLSGYLSNLRIVKGAAVYTGNFTPPTGQLATSGAASAASYPSTTNVNTSFASSDTSLLTLQTRGATQNIGFVDSSPNKFPITKVGNTTQGTFSPYGNLWSNYFDGTGDYLSVPDSPAFLLSGDFTIESFVYPTAFPTDGTIMSQWPGGSNNSFTFRYTTSGRPYFAWNIGGSAVGLTGTTTSVLLNSWNHVAVTRSGSTVRLFVNGILDSTTGTASGSLSNSTSDIRIGFQNTTDGNLYVNGYLSNTRLVNGTALYTSNFTPSAIPLTAVSGTSLLTCQSNRFIDNSSNNFAITVNGNTSVQRFSPFNPTAPYSAATIGGSGYFDGTGDYLSAPSNAALAPGSSAFTWECWFYPTAAWEQTSSTGDVLFITEVTSGLQIGRPGSITGNVWGLCSNAVAWRLTSTTLPTLSQWNHMAVVRSGTGTNQTALFLNGARVAQGTVTDTFAQGVSYIMDGTSVGANESTGYISDMRLLNGTALYDPASATYTVPTSPLTAITNTSLLCNFTNAGIPDAAMMNDLETVGNAQVSTSVKKYGTGSLYFDGTGDYLKMPISPNLLFNTGDFTVEAWVYSTSGSASQFIWATHNSGTVSGWYMMLSGGKLDWGAYGNGSNSDVASSASYPVNQWFHAAVTKSNGTLRLFINGNQEYSGSDSANNYATAPYPFTVGADQDGTHPFFGYIDDLRITKGLARYTANFTPPAQSLPKQ